MKTPRDFPLHDDVGAVALDKRLLRRLRVGDDAEPLVLRQHDDELREVSCSAAHRQRLAFREAGELETEQRGEPVHGQGRGLCERQPARDRCHGLLGHGYSPWATLRPVSASSSVIVPTPAPLAELPVPFSALALTPSTMDATRNRPKAR